MNIPAVVQIQNLIERYDDGELDTEYVEFIMEHSLGDRVICNGDTLLSAIEDLYMFDEFINSMVV